MTEAPAAASSHGGIPLTAPRVPTGMNAGVSITPCGVVRRPRRPRRLRSPRRAPPCGSAEPASTSNCNAMGWESALRLRLLAEVDHPRLDALRDVEHEAVGGDGGVHLHVGELVVGPVAVRLDVLEADRQERLVVDPQAHRLDALRDAREAG